MFVVVKQLICRHQFIEYETKHLYVAECLKCGLTFPH